MLLQAWFRVAPCGKLMNGAMNVHLPCVRAEFKDVPCWCRCGMVGEEGNVQSRKTRSGVNSSSDVCMRVKKATLGLLPLDWKDVRSLCAFIN